jgi:hypothetical protein
MRMTWRSFLVAVATVAATGGATNLDARYEPEVWLAEFATLRVGMAAHYANLDWMVSHRKLDLKELTRETEASLRSASTERQARTALSRFIAAFDDPHLRLVASAAPPRLPNRVPSEASRAERGFEVRDRSFRFPFPKATGWQKAGGPWFPAGSYGDVGVLRIAHFGEDGYLEACEEVGPDLVRERLQDELKRTIGTLRERGVRVLVVDISGNGGGTEWVAEVTRLLTAKTMRRPGAQRSRPACDRGPIWDGVAVCPVLAAATEATMQGEGAWDGPLAVLVDGRTASASEDMVVWLRESRLATIIGETT